MDDASPAPPMTPTPPATARAVHVVDKEGDHKAEVAEVAPAKRPVRERKRRERKALLLSMNVGTCLLSHSSLVALQGCQTAPLRRSLGL